MKPLQIYGPLPQAKTALDVLSMLTDKKKRKEVMGALKAVEEARERLNETIAVYGKAEKIGSLLNSAVEKEAEANRLLDAANLEAADVRAEAKKETDASRFNVKLREEAVDVLEKGLVARDTELTSGLDAREARLLKREEKVTDLAAKTSARVAVLEARETKYRDRKKALEAIPPL